MLLVGDAMQATKRREETSKVLPGNQLYHGEEIHRLEVGQWGFGYEVHRLEHGLWGFVYEIHRLDDGQRGFCCCATPFYTTCFSISDLTQFVVMSKQ